MALTLTQTRKQQKFLVPILITLVFVAIVIIWFMFLREGGEVILEGSLPIPAPKIKIDFGVLDNPLLDRFELFPEPPGYPLRGEIGRDNPFLSY